MNQKATQVFYGLSMFVLATALFIMQPNNAVEVTTLRSEVLTSLHIAWQQTWGDAPVTTSIVELYEGTESFYAQASDSLIGLTSYPEGDAAIAQVFGQVYGDFAKGLVALSLTVNGSEVAVASDEFMTQPPIENIIPSIVPVASINIGSVSGTITGPWFTATDGLTGQKYCVALFNGEFNKYIGECKNEYH